MSQTDASRVVFEVSDWPVTIDAGTGEVIGRDSDAEVIGALYARSRMCLVDSVQAAYDCGLRLLEKKAQLQHGQWLPWLAANQSALGFTNDSTARRLMTLARSNRALTHDLDIAEVARISRQLWGNEPAEPQHKRDLKPLPKNGKTVEDLAALEAGSFGCIYADPPWQYNNQGTRAAQGNHYDGMSVQEICELPVARLAAEAAHLHLWTTNAFLFDARLIMEAWGFTYKSCFVWVKPQMGIGNYWRVSHELMLLGVKGSLPFADKSLISWAEIPRGKHSEKPEQVREFIQRASPGPYLEMFARRCAAGWTAWGNEIEREVFAA